MMGFCPIASLVARGLLPIDKWVIAHHVCGMITNQSIIDMIESYCATHAMAETTFGKKAVNDGKLLSRLREGKSISIDTYNRIVGLVSKVEEAAE
jgi:hypothetical protein